MRKHIITDRLYLRPPVIEDAHAIKSLISYDVAQWFTLMPWPYHLSDAVEWLTQFNPPHQIPFGRSRGMAKLLA